jgi:hypothetical protein
MLLHFIRIAIISTVILLCVFLPFIPGSYDGLAVSVSFMAQLFAMAGLSLVPIGLIWIIFELIRRTKKVGSQTYKNRTHTFAIVSLVVMCFIAIIVSLGAFGNNNHFLGICSLVIWIYLVPKIIIKSRHIKNANSSNINPTPFYLICIPLVVIIFRTIFIVPATEFSRNYAIKQSEKLIQDIEA